MYIHPNGSPLTLPLNITRWVWENGKIVGEEKWNGFTRQWEFSKTEEEDYDYNG